MNLVEAIARQEGFYTPGSRPNRNNNPGDLEYGAFAKRNGATSGDPRFAVFPSVAVGLEALAILLKYNYEGLTLYEAINKFAPSFENNAQSYLDAVCRFTGYHPTDIVTDAMLGNYITSQPKTPSNPK